MKPHDIPLISPSTEHGREGRLFNVRNMPSITLAGSLAIVLAGAAVFSIDENTSSDSNKATHEIEQQLNQKALAAIQSGPHGDSAVYGSYRISPDDSPYQTIYEIKNTLRPTVDTARLAGYIALEASARELIKLRDGGSDIDMIILFSADIDDDGKDEVLAKAANPANLINFNK